MIKLVAKDGKRADAMEKNEQVIYSKG